MYRQHGSGARPGRRLERLHIKNGTIRLHIGENRRRPQKQNGMSRGYPRSVRHDDLISGADARLKQGQRQGCRPAGCGNDVRHAEQVRHAFLELPRYGAKRHEPPLHSIKSRAGSRLSKINTPPGHFSLHARFPLNRREGWN